MQRVLTKFFPSRAISRFLKKYDKKSVFDIVDLLMTFDIDTMAEFICVGNPEMDLDAAYNKLDDYIQTDESRSFMSTAMTLLVEFDMDKHVLTSLGVPASKIKERMDESIAELSTKFDSSLNEAADNAVAFASAAQGSSETEKEDGDIPDNEIEITRDTSV